MNPHTTTSENLKIKESRSDNRSFGVGVKTLTINLIRLYQIIFSRSRGLVFFSFLTGCRFYPSCSDYSIKAIGKHGFLKGAFKSVIRVFKCNPWSKGGVDYP